MSPESLLLRLCALLPVPLPRPPSPLPPSPLPPVHLPQGPAQSRPSPITSAPPWDYSTNVRLKLSVLKGEDYKCTAPSKRG